MPDFNFLTQLKSRMQELFEPKMMSPLAEAKPLPVSKPQAPSPAPPLEPPTPTPTPPPQAGAIPYVEVINQSANQFGVPQDILYRVLQKESSWNPNIISGQTASPAGALGIAQFMPDTARGMGGFNPLDPNQAIPKAAEYLSNLFQQFGNWESALAAYNAGPGNVNKYGGIPPFPETQRYVEGILTNE
jgi:peptidoglycan DL-endopeptidase CwlO